MKLARECALEKLQSANESLVLIESKREFNGSIKRCFTLEHIFPTKCLINFFYQVFEENNPTPNQTQLILSTLNACCYVWQEENINIAKSGLISGINLIREKWIIKDILVFPRVSNQIGILWRS